MRELPAPSNPLYALFREELGDAILRYVSSREPAETVDYLADLLVRFMHTDSIFRVEGRPLDSLSSLLESSDPMTAAIDTEREREIHRHVGDFLLFALGMYPPILREVRWRMGSDLVVDFPAQARQSYRIASEISTTKTPPAPEVLARLSEGLEDYTFTLSVLRERLLWNPHMGQA